jgi:hypothetical protein
MPFSQNAPGLFVVRYDSADALAPERQRALELALRDASAARDVGIVFVVDPSVPQIDPGVPAYWLGITGDATIRLRAMAIVTQQPAVSVSTRGFATANILRDRPVTVKPFRDEGEAVAWVKETLEARA